MSTQTLGCGPRRPPGICAWPALHPGAWHSPYHYSALIGLLEAYQYDVVTGRLPGVGSSNPKAQSVANDAAFIRNSLLNPLLNDGKDILLLMHSYGGWYVPCFQSLNW